MTKHRKGKTWTRVSKICPFDVTSTETWQQKQNSTAVLFAGLTCLSVTCLFLVLQVYLSVT